MNCRCPKCNETFPVMLEALIPAEQVMCVKLTSESELFPADTIGSTIVNTTKLLQAIAREAGTPLTIFVKSVELKPHEVTIAFLMTVIKKP
jgi:hypothetical protein